ncbi:S8 family serine peptidase [Marinihelvus fidelis]|uniref:S8 family serine peptidase n=1 Tax=Marinihelvus fidelis TaxID=2613842 RepID=A0A5N0T571_9GAMM|nr:S8 family serine peptidase [Marinihelvus fidelis]KAA9130205.1 S8 family serine peptidase [Marinihelvus fidelis]
MVHEIKELTFTRVAGKTLAAALGVAMMITTAQAAPEDRKINASAVTASAQFNRFIVKFDENTRGNSAKVRASLDNVARGQGVGLQMRRQLAVGSHVIETDRKLPAAATEALMRAFARRNDVEFIEPDAMMRPMLTPNDTYYGAQWHYHDATGGMALPGAWDIATGAGVVVAVLDTGQTNHEDLVGNMVPGYDFISDTFISRDGDGRDNDPNDEGDWNPVANECGFGSPITDSSWHGTHVAGTIAAVTNNNQGVAGVAFDAQVQHVRVLGRCGGLLSDISDAIIWASGGSVSGVPANATPASVINMSLGGSGSCSGTYQSAIDTAIANGASVVVSAGNSNANAANYRPASCNGVITVAASDQSESRASYSNYGSTVEITAPGGDFNRDGVAIASTLNDGATTQTTDGYYYYQGTSMSAPHISGLVALMLEVAPTLTPAEVSQAIQDNARPLAGSCSGGCGAGIADAEATLLALGDPEPPVNEDPVANFSFACSFLDCDFNDSSSDSDGTIASRAWTFGDGGSSSATNPSHSYGAAGTYSVQLTVTDDDGATDTVTKSVTVSEEPPANEDPVAAFSASCTFLACDFTDASSDSDGSIVSRSWTFGDGGSSGAANPSHTYGAAGTYSVQLTVTDDDGATDTVTQSVTVEEEPSGPTPPAAPTNLTLDVVTQGKGRNKTVISVELGWNDNASNEDSYEIQSCIESGKGRNKVCNFATQATVGANTTSWSDGSPADNKIYRVRAVNSAGESDWSNEAKS